MFSLILSQCTRLLKAKLVSNPELNKVSKDYYTIEILKMIKVMMYNFESQKHKYYYFFEFEENFN